jgi:hypothetical protein
MNKSSKAANETPATTTRDCTYDDVYCYYVQTSDILTAYVVLNKSNFFPGGIRQRPKRFHYYESKLRTRVVQSILMTPVACSLLTRRTKLQRQQQDVISNTSTTVRMEDHNAWSPFLQG